MNLSLIDNLNYTQAQPPADMPAFLDVHLDGICYQYSLLIANLGEQKKGQRMPTQTHTHPVFHIVLYVAGQGFANLAEHMHPVAPGTLIIASPDQPHAFEHSGGNLAYHAITFAVCRGEQHLKCNINQLLSIYLGRPVRIPEVSQLETNAYALIRRRIETLVQHLQSQPIDWIQHQQDMIALLALLGTIGVIANTAPNKIELAQSIIENRFTDPDLTLQALAQELHTSPENLCRQFRHKTGTSPIQYRNRLRAQAATALLRNTNLPGTEIAKRLGYNDLYTFSKAYRRATGFTPTRNRS